MKTQKKIIDAYIVTIYKRGEIVDNSYKPNDVSRFQYIELDNGNYDVHCYQGGNCVSKAYNVKKQDLVKSFEWEESKDFPQFYSRYKMISKEIHFV